MGRQRKTGKHLPRRLQFKHGAYYYVTYRDGLKVWEGLGRDYGVALLKWAEYEGRKPESARNVEHAIAHYLETERHRLRPATMTGYNRSSARLIAVFGNMELCDLKPSEVYEYVRRYGNVQANRDKALLSAVYSAARTWGWFAGDNPAKGVRRNVERARKRYVTDAELGKLVDSASPQLASIIRFAYLTGMRESDILRVRLGDMSDDGIRVDQGKTGRQQLITWTEELRAVIADARAARGRVSSLWLFAGRAGQPYTGDGFRAMWRRVKLKAGLADVTFHDLRRKAGSDVSDEHARALLGHQDARTTRKHYRAKPEKVRPVR